MIEPLIADLAVYTHFFGGSFFWSLPRKKTKENIYIPPLPGCSEEST